MKIITRILHVDDNTHDRKLVKDAFLHTRDEFEILEADDRNTFEKLLSEADFELVLSDFNILGFDGFQVLQHVREVKPDIPIIIVTGTGSEEIAVQAMKLGAYDYVIKSASHIRNLVPTVRNVLERKRIEAEHKLTLIALRESEERFRLFFENSMDAVLMTIPDGTILKANPAACEIFGKSESEIIAGGRQGIIDITDQRLPEAIKQRKLTGRFSGELTGIRNDGILFPIEISSSIFEDKTGKKISSMIIKDIGKRKATEEALQNKLNQLELFHRLTVDRELVMIELKKEVNELLGKLGLPEKYH
jgi:PAS domain S-box-containing protein